MEQSAKFDSRQIFQQYGMIIWTLNMYSKTSQFRSLYSVIHVLSLLYGFVG